VGGHIRTVSNETAKKRDGKAGERQGILEIYSTGGWGSTSNEDG